MRDGILLFLQFPVCCHRRVSISFSLQFLVVPRKRTNIWVDRDWIHDQWDYPPEAASWTTSLYSFAAIFFAPTLGLLLDYLGGLGYAAIMGPFCTVMLFLVCGLVGTGLPPYVIMFSMGVLYSCAAALQGGVPRLVDDKYVGTAYGIAYSNSSL